jgi:hypothetical protein
VEPVVSPWRFCMVLCIGMLVMIEIGRRIGVRRRLKDSEEDKGGLSTLEGAIFALFGLMIAFTFSGAASRFNEKRMLIAEEANTIEAAYLRLQLLSQDSRAALQSLFREYTDSRIETYRRLPNMTAAQEEMERSKKLQEEIWTAAVAASGRTDAHPDAGKLLLPALNAMIDIATTRSMALQIHPPRIIYMLLFVLGVLCSLLAGFRMAGSRHRSWLHILAFAIVTVSVVYVILDVEYPRGGLIHIETADQFLTTVRGSMH